MKKICILASAALLSISSANAQARLGLIGSMNQNDQIDHYEGYTSQNQLKTGFHGGLLAEFCLGKNWTIQPGLIYTLKGGEQEGTQSYMANDGMHDVKIKDKNSLHYIEVPVNLIYRIPVGTGHIFVGAGGYAATLVSAYTNYKYTNTVNGNDVSMPNSSGTMHLKVGDKNADNDNLHRFDFGLTGILGYEFHCGLFLRGGVDAGLSNIIKAQNTIGFASSLPSTASSDPTSKNITYMFSIGYMFRH